MSKISVPLVLLSAVVFCTADVSATELGARQAKPRLVPRALPSDLTPSSIVEERLIRKPVNGGASSSGVVLQQADEKARIGVIRRGVGGMQTNGHDPNGRIESDTLKGVLGGMRSATALPPLRPGQIRVLPKLEVKTGVGDGVTAQQTP